MTDLVRPTPGSGDIQYGEWIGRIALAVIFLFNGFGIVDQSRAAQELAAHGTPTGGLCFVAFRSIPSLPSHITEIHAPASR